MEPTSAELVVEAEVTATSSTSPPTASAASSDVLRMLNKLQKEGLFEDEKALKVLKSLARKNDEQLLTTYKASYEDGVLEESAFDKAFLWRMHLSSRKRQQVRLLSTTPARRTNSWRTLYNDNVCFSYIDVYSLRLLPRILQIKL